MKNLENCWEEELVAVPWPEIKHIVQQQRKNLVLVVARLLFSFYWLFFAKARLVRKLNPGKQEYLEPQINLELQQGIKGLL